ncbi:MULTISPECIES: amino acid ABC transporter permease [Pseudonocardia]|uniref:Amino acid ABC transporter membrane protein 1, PAAT family n=1 Tax=Pseudonocardia oroxyli TaxID=366584 RepID=A0A1G7JYK2_PSEOR|nr:MULTISPECIES: amino acid ABC transporter permease [Pseudonocardia]MCF7550017.1 amino acid ABC transporter permease [Pseudonocardia sp. WMMC193]SDF30036.1 amino acid ABC transporter membrane protein 1, PAAT family [Pseudonocardia oroxyli]
MGVLIEQFPLYVSGFLGTLRLCVFAAIGSLVLGTVIAACRVSPVPPLRALGSAWVTVFRNTPLAVVLFAVAFGLPELGVNGSYFWFGVAGLTFYTSAFVCEAVRSGINSVPPGQAEAARAVGLTFTQSLSLVILPQAFRTVVPPLGSVIIAMIKNSAIAGAFGIGGDLFAVGSTLTSAQGYAAAATLFGVLLGYLVLTIPAGIGLARLEKKLAVAR